MLAKLTENPLANDRMFGGAMENVHLPEAEQDLTDNQLPIDITHGPNVTRDALISNPPSVQSMAKQ